MTDGVSTRELFEINRGTTLAYNDFIILPDYTDFGTFDIDLTTKLSKNISLKIPLISSPMDKVTEDEMAKWMALWAGLE
ncbi:MAG: IMP dehydrogenase [bacterium]